MSEWMGAEEHAHRALEHFERGRWTEAEAELRKALAVDPERGEWQFNLGLTLDAAGRHAEALECFRAASELLPEEPEPLVAAAQLANRLGRHADAALLCERAARLGREATDDGCHAVWIDALRALDRLDEAETIFHLARLENDDVPRSLLAFAEVLIERAAWPRAEWCLREAIRLEPMLPRVRARLAKVFASTGRPARAVQLFSRELRNDPGSIETLLEFGDLLLDLNRLGEASEKFRRVLELEPANIEAHRSLGRVALRTGRTEQALLEFDLAARLDPGLPGIRLDLAEAHLAAGRPEAAARCLAEEVESRGESPAPDGAAARLGDLLLRAGQSREAVPFLEAAVAQEASGERLRRLALALFESDDLDRGARVGRRVLRIDPACVRTMHNLALAALRRGRHRRALAWIRAGLAVDAHDDGLRRLRMRVWYVLLRARVAALVRRVRRGA